MRGRPSQVPKAPVPPEGEAENGQRVYNKDTVFELFYQNPSEDGFFFFWRM